MLENMRRLGSGAFYHLAYAKHQIHPDVIEQLRKAHPANSRIKLYWLSQENTAIRFASGEIITVHWFSQFVRIHFMILDVLSNKDTEEIEWPTEFMVSLTTKHK